MNRELGAVSCWLDLQRRRSGLVVKRVRLSECENWRLEAGRLVHKTGRYFSIVGCHCDDGPPHLNKLSLPIIDQPEIGILGFVVRRGHNGWEWLLQAKTEPGNVGGTQVGPTVQATYSNYMCIHGGKPTQMLDLFIGNKPVINRIADVEQSEQGDRFWGKYNRNMTVQVGHDCQSPDQNIWRWFTAKEVREALQLDFTINTDARSVLFCSDWSLLSDQGDSPAFSRWQGQGGFGELLLQSSMAKTDSSSLAAAIQTLDRIRNTTRLHMVNLPLESLPGWHIDDFGISSTTIEDSHAVEAYAVSSEDREIRSWCQPLMRNISEGRVVLVCTQRGGVLHFLIHASIEPGFKETVQFGPSWVSGLGHERLPGLTAAIDDTESITHASVMQSDEGGRFMHSVARYQIIELSEALATACEREGIWVPLSALRKMAFTRGALTNELRSVLSMLLIWA